MKAPKGQYNVFVQYLLIFIAEAEDLVDDLRYEVFVQYLLIFIAEIYNAQHVKESFRTVSVDIYLRKMNSFDFNNISFRTVSVDIYPNLFMPACCSSLFSYSIC